jgi:hypothetical protein
MRSDLIPVRACGSPFCDLACIQVLDALQGTSSQLHTIISAGMEALDISLYNCTVALAQGVLLPLDTISTRLRASSEDGYRQLEAVRGLCCAHARCMHHTAVRGTELQLLLLKFSC